MQPTILTHESAIIALAMLGMGVLLPLFRFLVPLVYFWPHPYAQIILLLSDFVLLTGGLLFVTFHSMLEGIRAENENKEFI
ncbi:MULTISPECIES: hypothetical protein [unclassified Klebsiella]|uniref:hypothetical protein n=1 Tax=unclassified Klebsiella TaxID=2608929 RepID=UPI001D182E62|nr:MULTISPECIES: hypothetical protein [unclassified Klebsiella]